LKPSDLIRDDHDASKDDFVSNLAGREALAKETLGLVTLEESSLTAPAAQPIEEGALPTALT
jgi:hypothetical protein